MAHSVEMDVNVYIHMYTPKLLASDQTFKLKKKAQDSMEINMSLKRQNNS